MYSYNDLLLKTKIAAQSHFATPAQNISAPADGGGTGDFGSFITKKCSLSKNDQS
jgi:hypothetical protein